MMKIEWKRAALWIFVGATVAVLSHAILGAPSAAGQRGGSTAAAPDSTTLYLPNHRYDLPATYVSAAQIQAHKLKMVAAKEVDVPIDMVKVGGSSDKHQAGISLVIRQEGQTNQFAVHDDVAEVYYMIEGSGTMLLGGKLIDPVRRPPSAGNGMGLSGTQSEGSQEVNLAQGDMLIVPAGTPHEFKKANEFTVYTVVRIDPDGVAPLLK
jgi:mannose-6-phosphate isomerase-like protein (cupin superfamily)